MQVIIKLCSDIEPYRMKYIVLDMPAWELEYKVKKRLLLGNEVGALIFLLIYKNDAIIILANAGHPPYQ